MLCTASSREVSVQTLQVEHVTLILQNLIRFVSVACQQILFILLILSVTCQVNLSRVPHVPWCHGLKWSSKSSPNTGNAWYKLNQMSYASLIDTFSNLLAFRSSFPQFPLQTYGGELCISALIYETLCLMIYVVIVHKIRTVCVCYLC
jgi:hypothetical protein